MDDCRLSDDVSEISCMKYRNGMKKWHKKSDMLNAKIIWMFLLESFDEFMDSD